MGKLKDAWMELTAPYLSEELEDYIDAMNTICGKCTADSDTCATCQVKIIYENLKKKG